MTEEEEFAANTLMLLKSTTNLMEEVAAEVLAEPNSPPTVSSVDDQDIFEDIFANIFSAFEETRADEISPDPEPILENVSTEETADGAHFLEEHIEKVLAEDPHVVSPAASPRNIISAEASQSTHKGKEIVTSPTSEPTDPELANAERNLHLKDIISSLHSIKTDMGKLTVNSFVTSEYVSKIKGNVKSQLKTFAKDIADFATSLDSKVRKSSLNQLQSQQFLSDKIDLMNTRFDAIDAKLATITAALLTLSQPSSGVIDKNGEKYQVPSKPTDYPNKKRPEPHTSRKDKELADKRPKH